MIKMKAVVMALCVAGCAGPYLQAAGGKFAASSEESGSARQLAVTMRENRDGGRETEEERQKKKAELEEVNKGLGGCLEYKPDDPNDKADSLKRRSESWSKQFRIYEQLPNDVKIPLGTDALQYVDTSSRIVIERISDVPKTIAATDGTRDERLGVDPVGFDVDVVIVAATDETRSGTKGCRRLAPVPGLQDIGGYDRGHIEPGCQDLVYRAYTRPGPIEKGARYVIPPWTFHSGDGVQIQLEGRKIGVEEVTVPLTDKSTIEFKGNKVEVDHKAVVGPFKVKLDGFSEDGQKQDSLKAVAAGNRDICATPFTVSFRTLNYSSIKPFEDRGGSPYPLVHVNGRSDNRNDVYFAFERLPAELSDALFRDAVSMTATAIDGDQKTRTVGLAKNASRPTLDHLNDGETIVIGLARKIAGDDGKTSEVPIRSYTFTAVAAGLHAAASGERKANLGISTGALFMLLKHSDQHYGFAQTFSYTVFNKPLRPSFWDEVGGGVHVSVLARSKDSGATDDKPLALGVGGHLALGANTVHIGMGYDVINNGAYFLLGLSIPDLADFFSAQSITTH